MTSHSNLQLIIDALTDYADQTGTDLSQNPFAVKIQHFDTPDAILELLREREKAFKEYRDANRSLIDCLIPAVRVLHVFSGLLGEAVSLVPFSPAKAVFIGIDVLLDAASGVSSSYDTLLDLFECLGSFLKRLEIYINIPPALIITDIVVKIIVELLSVLSLATKQIRQGRFKKFAKKLFGESEIEAVLQRLDRLTQDEARITVAQTLSVVHGLVNNMRVVMEDGKASTDSIREALTSLQKIVNEVNKIKRDQFQRDIRLWLSPPDPSTNHNIVWEGHHKGTAKWFFEGSILADWKSNGSLLWIHGKPGCGKSTLLSAIIRDIEDVKKQDRYGLLSSLLCQLSAKSDSCYEILYQLYSDNANGTGQPDNSALTDCIKDMLSLPGQGSVYIIIDALDECPNISGTPSAREKVLELVEDLIQLNLPNIHLCVTSRPEADIRRVLDPLTSLQISLHNESGQMEDIISYIKSVIHSDRSMRKWREEDRQLVIDILSEKADGMFRWVVCQIDRLRRTFPASIRGILDELPKGLDETYGHTLLQIDEEKRDYAQRLFRCLTVSIRPLRVEELAEIFAVRFDKIALPTFNPGWRPVDASEAVLSACSSLISIVDVAGSQVVQFSHFSVKEFLTSNRLANSEMPLSSYHVLPEPSHSTLACASLSVLLQLDDKVDRSTIHHFPFALYAAQYWISHALFGNMSLHVQDMVKRLFDLSKPHFAAWVWLYDVDRHWLDPMAELHPTRPSAVPLYYASLCGLRVFVEDLVAAHPEEINARGGFYHTSLHAALAKGHFEIVELLLDNNADPNLCNDHGKAPLHSASQYGHVGVVKILLDRGVDVNQKEKTGWTPLHFASAYGRLEAAQFLIQCGAIVDTRNGGQETPLHKAAAGGSLGIAEFLLNSNASVNATDDDDLTPLHWAAYCGYRDMAELLLGSGASLDARTQGQETPLALACRRGRLEVSQLLLDRGSDVNSRSKDGWTPLHSASRYGHPDVTRLLLHRGADVNAQDSDRWTPLHDASASGHLDIVKVLIQHGANVHSWNITGQTPLHEASWHGHLKISRFLLEHGASVSSQDDKGFTPFHAASQSGHLHVVKFLLERGIDVDIRNGKGQTSLDLASGSGMLDVVRFLIENGSDIHTRDYDGWNPLHIASQNGHIDVVRLLIDIGAAVDIRNGTQMTPLALASSTGQAEVASLLIERAADMDARDSESWAPLHLASQYGHVGITRLLLDRGVDPNISNVDRWHPLHLASANGHLSIAQCLIQHGARVDVFNDEGQTPFDRAAGNGNIKILHLLVNNGASLHTTDNSGCTPLHSASLSGHLDVVLLLLQWDADVDVLNKANKTAGEMASENGKVEVSSLLAEYKADANVRNNIHSATLDLAQHDSHEDGEDNKPISLHTASSEGNVDLVKSSLGRGADINSRNPSSETPLHIAAYYGNVEVVRLLIERGAEVDSRDKLGQTPLYNASRNGDVEVSRILIDHGANVNARKYNYCAPIHVSAYNGHLRLVELLLEWGVDTQSLNSDGQTAYQISLRQGHRKVSDLLREHGTHGV